MTETENLPVAKFIQIIGQEILSNNRVIIQDRSLTDSIRIKAAYNLITLMGKMYNLAKENGAISEIRPLVDETGKAVEDLTWTRHLHSNQKRYKPSDNYQLALGGINHGIFHLNETIKKGTDWTPTYNFKRVKTMEI